MSNRNILCSGCFVLAFSLCKLAFLSPFYHGPDVSLTKVMVLPIIHVTDLPSTIYRQEKTCLPWLVCKRCGVVAISRHYGVGHGSVLCQSLF